jgi:hypothetical protein
VTNGAYEKSKKRYPMVACSSIADDKCLFLAVEVMFGMGKLVILNGNVSLLGKN